MGSTIGKMFSTSRARNSSLTGRGPWEVSREADVPMVQGSVSTHSGLTRCPRRISRTSPRPKSQRGQCPREPGTRPRPEHGGLRIKNEVKEETEEGFNGPNAKRVKAE